MGSGDLIQRGWKGLPSFCVAWCRVFKVMYMFQMSQEIVSSWIKLFRSTYSNIVFSHYAAKNFIWSLKLRLSGLGPKAVSMCG